MLTLLGACDRTGSRADGIEVAIEALPVGTAHEHDEGHHTEQATAKHSSDRYVTFRRGDGMKIDLQLGLVNLVPVELQPCDSLTMRLHRGLEWLSPLSSAHAHADHDSAASAGPIDVVAGHAQTLGTLAARPGRYCALVAELRPGTRAAKHGGGLDTTLDGAAIGVAPCYYPTTVGMSDEEAAAVTAHSCIQAKAQDTTRRLTLPFPAGVVLDAANTDLTVTVAIHYEAWFEDIDFATLEHDAAQQARLADNVVAALQAWTDRE
ncbi:hypothetical protein ABSH63_12730 [Sinimarinibacterium sp. HSW-8]|uniref:Lipoprotein n=2 Tax=Sinimarinibacterium thermocellulolyticum TaxID=3170016 RepID=A0ABV2ACA2_9GAMM